MRHALGADLPFSLLTLCVFFLPFATGESDGLAQGPTAGVGLDAMGQLQLVSTHGAVQVNGVPIATTHDLELLETKILAALQARLPSPSPPPLAGFNFVLPSNPWLVELAGKSRQDFVPTAADQVFVVPVHVSHIYVQAWLEAPQLAADASTQMPSAC